MKIATFQADGAARVGLVNGGRILDLAAAQPGGPASVLDLLSRPEGLSAARRALDGAASEHWRALSGVKLLAPIPRPQKNVFCVGRNYKLHIEEGARARGVPVSFPKVPEFFSKPPTTVIGPDADIRLSPVTQKLDYEVELAFVIGTPGRDISEANALKHVAGFTVLNDVSARDLQQAHGQWFKGKGLDTTCPIGPWIVTSDEFDVSRDHQIKLRVNGETRQDALISDMLFDCAKIIESLSAGMTLEAGDIVATGTPSGVGLGLSPQIWLKAGDVIEAEIEGIGVLRNTVRTA